MAHATSRSTSRKAAAVSRLGEVCATGPKGGESWYRPLRRTRRAIASCQRLIDASCQVIEASEELSARYPIRTSRQLQRASHWLTVATTRLGRAVQALDDTTVRVQMAPERADGSPIQLMDAAVRWLNAATRLAGTSDRLQITLDRLVADVEGGIIIPSIAGEEEAARIVHHPRLIAAPLCLQCVRRRDRLRKSIPRRRRRSAPPTLAEAVRRVTRGRAPPSVSTRLL